MATKEENKSCREKVVKTSWCRQPGYVYQWGTYPVLIFFFLIGTKNLLIVSEWRSDNCRLVQHSVPEQRLSITQDSILS